MGQYGIGSARREPMLHFQISPSRGFLPRGFSLGRPQKRDPRGGGRPRSHSKSPFETPRGHPAPGTPHPVSVALSGDGENFDYGQMGPTPMGSLQQTNMACAVTPMLTPVVRLRELTPASPGVGPPAPGSPGAPPAARGWRSLASCASRPGGCQTANRRCTVRRVRLSALSPA